MNELSAIQIVHQRLVQTSYKCSVKERLFQVEFPQLRLTVRCTTSAMRKLLSLTVHRHIVFNSFTPWCHPKTRLSLSPV